MRWQKLGRVYTPSGSSTWSSSHAYLPTPFALNAETIRVYVAFLDQERIGRVGFIDVSASDPCRIVATSPHPVLDIGEPGAFDDNGVSPVSVIKRDGLVWLYYIGWQLGVKVPYFLFSGLAISRDGGATFARTGSIPVLDRVEGEHACRSALSVRPEGRSWRGWYVAGDRWIDVGGKLLPRYHIRHASSPDGLRWTSPGEVAVELAGEDEFGLGRPFVVPSKDGYRMWYSVRTHSKGYRMGYATSVDGLVWNRRDPEVGIDVSDDGWDSQMICFAAIHETKYGTFMFYNGNNYGETGFGAAVLIDEG